MQNGTLQLLREPPMPACYRMTELFFGPDVDGRTDKEREAREVQAKHFCTQCPYRLRCLERVAITEYRHAANGVFGVAGGMSEGERKQFYEHLRGEGYISVPEGAELLASVSAFYRQVVRARLSAVI